MTSDIGQLIELASTEEFLTPGIETQIKIIEKAMNVIGSTLADQLELECPYSQIEIACQGGASVSFNASFDGQNCHPALQELDPHGDLYRAVT